MSLIFMFSYKKTQKTCPVFSKFYQNTIIYNFFSTTYRESSSLLYIRICMHWQFAILKPYRRKPLRLYRSPLPLRTFSARWLDSCPSNCSGTCRSILCLQLKPKPNRSRRQRSSEPLRVSSFNWSLHSTSSYLRILFIICSLIIYKSQHRFENKTISDR